MIKHSITAPSSLTPTMSRSIPPRAGVWAPALTLYDPDTNELDLESQAQYFGYLSKHLTGLVILGTNAETFLLTREERAALLQTARKNVQPGQQIIAGVGGHSTKQVLEYISDAAAAGSDYVLVLPPGYFGKATTTKVITNFYDEVAAKSPLPILIYNFPGVCNGVDLESDVISALAKKHANIVGVKLTCASVAKVTRLAATFAKDEFAVFGGQSDFLVGGLAAGSSGCIAAFANVFPKTIKMIYDTYSAGDVANALQLNQATAIVELVSKAGIANTKYAAALTSATSAGIENAADKLKPRRPYEAPSDEVKAQIEASIKAVKDIEDSLP